MSAKQRVLFVCRHNSARSQMAEAFLNQLGGDHFEVMSAGIEAGTLNPLVVTAMKEVGIDISGNKTKSAFDLFKQGQLFRFVIAVCDEASAEQCPIFPGRVTRMQWGFPDPSQFLGSENEKLALIREVRDAIKARVETFLEEARSEE